MTALWQRRRTGRGQFIDRSLAEGVITQIGEFIVAYSSNGKQPDLIGNSHDYFAPYGCYPTSGEDKWITICVQSEEQWQVFCDIMGNPYWSTKGNFVGQTSRHRNKKELDRLIAKWTVTKESNGLMNLLQRRGIAAGAVLNGRELLENPHLNDRGYFADIEETEIGIKRYPGQAIRIGGTFQQTFRPSPRLGEHTRRILKDLLDLQNDTIIDLEANGVVAFAK